MGTTSGRDDHTNDVDHTRPGHVGTEQGQQSRIVQLGQGWPWVAGRCLRSDFAVRAEVHFAREDVHCYCRRGPPKPCGTPQKVPPCALHVDPVPEAERVKPLQDLLRELQPDVGSLDGNFATLREKLLAIAPLDTDHVAKVNTAEAEFWRLSTGERIADSTQVLGFECGGSQWVLENCFPVGTIDNPSLADIDYLIELKQMIEQERIPAASPIEQRWTSSSRAPMSPAYSTDPTAIFSWVGVILYIVDEARAPATKAKFKEYAMRHVDQTFKYGGTFHWAKVDLSFHEGARLEDLRKNFQSRFDTAGFADARRKLDPNRILSNRLVDTALA